MRRLLRRQGYCEKMKAQHKYEVDTEVIKAFETTEKMLKDMKPKDRLDYFELTASMLGDIQSQCTHIGKVLSRDDIMVSMTEKQYAALFEDVQTLNFNITEINKTFAKKVPTLTE